VGGQRDVPAALPPGKTQYPLYRRLGGPQVRSGRVRIISPPPGFDPRTVQPVVSRYTVWAISPHIYISETWLMHGRCILKCYLLVKNWKFVDSVTHLRSGIDVGICLILEAIPWNCMETELWYLDDWLTVHRSITLVDLQLDAQNSYLFTYNTFIKILYMLLALPCSSSGGLRRNCIYAASGIVTVCRWLSCEP
jgi:hypothetical protein